MIEDNKMPSDSCDIPPPSPKVSIKEETSESAIENEELEAHTSEETGRKSPDKEGNISNGNHVPNGILKKKVAIETITLTGKDKLEDKWKDNYVPSDSEDNESSKPKKLDGYDQTMARKVTEIFEEVFTLERGHWSHFTEFFTCCIGMPIAFSSFWRFPYLISENGGGAFLFCYIVMFLLIGIPFHFMEAAIGQFAQLSCVHVWRCAPLMQGVGIAMIVLSLITSIYNSQLVVYVTHYFFSSFVNMDGTILWGECKISWEKCYDSRSNNWCALLNNVTGNADLQKCSKYLVPSSKYYWEEKVLRLTELGDFGKTGSIQWDLALCLVFVWTCVFIFLIRGTKSAGKVSLITGVLPFFILIAFLAVSLKKVGAIAGLIQFYKPDWEKLEHPEVWQKAAEQVIFSLCVSYGSIVTFSSYKQFRSRVQSASIILTVTNLLMSIVAATVTFALLGALAHSVGFEDAKQLLRTDVSAIEIAFVFYPEVIARVFPLPHLWAILFFLMLLCFGIQAQFSLVETCLTTVYDAIPRMRRRKFVVVSCLVIPLFLLCLPLCTNTGLHIHTLMESIIIGPNVLLLAIIEISSIQLLYGVRRFCRDVKLILKSEPSIVWKVFWVFVTPLTLLVLFIFASIDWPKMVFAGRREDKDWTLYLSWTLSLLPLLMIPLTFLFTLCYRLCIKEIVYQPSRLWGPGCSITREKILERRQLLKEASPSENNGSENDAFEQT